MRNNRGLSLIALIFSLAAVVPAYFLGVFLTDELLKRETQEYRVWQQSYVVDRQMYDAIAKSPPPRYHHPQEWTLRTGGGLLALILFIAVGRSTTDPDNVTGIAMPPKGGNSSLTDQDLADIVDYLRTLQ